MTNRDETKGDAGEKGQSLQSKAVRITCLVPSFEMPSVRLRTGAFLPFLREAGIDASLVEVPQNLVRRLRLFRQLQRFDGVLVAKKLFPAWQVCLLRRNAKKLVYDFDDAVMFSDSERNNFRSRTRRRRFVATARAADLVICGNEYLKEQTRPYTDSAQVVPTCIDLSAYKLKEHTPPADKVTIGWIGSRSTVKYLDFLRAVLPHLTSAGKRVELKVVADAFPEDLGIPLVKKQWRAEDEAEDLASFDLGLMPLPDNPWTRGKCGFKLLQYQAAGLPAVASPVGVNSQIVEDGVTGFLVESPEEWADKLVRLIGDDELRRRMGASARQHVEAHFSLATWGPGFADIIRATLVE